MLHVEMPELTHKKKFDDYKDVPQKGGVYIFYYEDQPVYAGKCKNLKDRIRAHKIGCTNTRRIFLAFESVKFFVEECPMRRDMYETFVINTIQPRFNLSKGFLYKPEFVRFPEVKVELREGELMPGKCQHIRENGLQCKMSLKSDKYCFRHKKLYEEKQKEQPTAK